MRAAADAAVFLMGGGKMSLSMRERQTVQEWARELNRPEPYIVTVDGPYVDEVMAMVETAQLKELVVMDMLDRATFIASEERPFDRKAPFIYYEPMNKGPEKWLALAKAKVAQNELGMGDGEGWVIMTLPRSANWEEVVIRESGIFPKAEYWPLTKDEEAIPEELNPQRIDVLSYVHNRKEDGSRGVEPMYIADPTGLVGRKVALFDDASAQGPSLVMPAQALKSQYGVASVSAVVTLDKGKIQGGYELVRDSGVIDELVVMASVAKGGVDTGLAGITAPVSIRGLITFER